MGGTATPTASLPQVPTPGALTSTLGSGGGSDPWSAFSSAPPDVRKKAIRALSGSDRAADLFMAAPQDVQRRTLPHLIAASKARGEEISSAPPAFTPSPKQGREATAKDMAHVALHTLPYVAGGLGALASVASGVGEAVAGAGLLADAVNLGIGVLGAGAGGAVGSAAQSGGEAALGTKDAPATISAAADRMWQSAKSQMEQEALGQGISLAGKGAIAGIGSLTMGGKFLASPEGRALTDLNSQLGTRLTASEMADSVIGKKAMEAGSIGVAGNIIARGIEKRGAAKGVAAARAILNSIGNNISDFNLGIKLAGDATDIDNSIGAFQAGQKAFMKTSGEAHQAVLAKLNDLPFATLHANSPLAVWLREVETQATKDVGGPEGKAAAARLLVAREVEANLPEVVRDSWLAGKPMQFRMSLPQLEGIRSSLGMFQPDAQAFFPGIAKAEGSKAYRSIVETMDEAEKQLPQKLKAGSRMTPADINQTLAQWREYRATVARGMRFYENGFSSKLAGADPMGAIQALMSGDPQKMGVLNRGLADYATSSPEAAREVARTRRMLQRSYLQDLIGSDLKTSKIGRKGVVGAEQAIATAGEKLEKADPAFVNRLFDTPESKAALGRFKTLSRLLSMRVSPNQYSGRFSLIELALTVGGSASAFTGLGKGAEFGLGSEAMIEAVTLSLTMASYSKTATKLIVDSLQGQFPPSKAVPNLIRAFALGRNEFESDLGMRPSPQEELAAAPPTLPPVPTPQSPTSGSGRPR